MKYILTVLLLLFAFTGEAQDYQKVSPFAEDTPIKGDFISPTQGWAYKFVFDELYSEDLYYTDDGGESWAVIYSLDYIWEKFCDIQMLDSQFGMATIYLAGMDYWDYRLTFDGGYTWTSILDTLPDGLTVQYIKFITPEIGFVCTPPLVAFESISIYKTVDSGLSWVLTENPDNALGRQNIIHAFDENHIWSSGYEYPTMGGGAIHYSNDSGNTWDLIHHLSLPVYDFEMVTATHGGYVGINMSLPIYNNLLITHDNFNTFTYVHYASEWQENFLAFCFQNELTVWVACAFGKVMVSEDGGATFNNYLNLGDYLERIEFFDHTGFIYSAESIYKLNYPVSNNDSEQILANDYQLTNYPNPFNPQTTISFVLEKTESVKLEVFNIKGQRVKTILNRSLNPGKHNYIWEGTDNQDNNVSSGVYLFRLEAGRESQIKQCVLIK